MRPLVSISIVAALAGDAAAQWTETIIEDAQPTSTSRGFDGAWRAYDDNNVEIVCSGAEQGTSNNIVVAAVDGSFKQTWGSNQGSEDVICGFDLNKDGVNDVASASEGQNRIRVWFGPFVDANANGINDNAGTFVTLQDIPAGGTINQAWIKLEVTDVDCDGDVDLVGGGKRIGANPAAWGWFEFVSGTTFTYHEIADVGWVMQLQAIDWDGDSPCRDDILITDKAGAGGVNANRGVWYWRSDGSNFPLAGTFVGTQIRAATGDEQFGYARDLDFNDCTDVVHGWASKIEILWNNCDDTYSPEDIPFPTDTTAGNFHSITPCPDTTINGPFILTFALAVGTDSGVVMIKRLGGGWLRTEISGPSGTAGVTRKWDNVFCGWTQTGKHYVLTSEGGDSTASDDKGMVKFTEP